MRAEDIPFLKPRRPLMVALTALWIPILLSAVIVFVASSVMHMVLPYHRSDYKKLPDEDKILAALRPAQLSPGLYIFPHCTHKDMKSPEIAEKQKQGPVGTMTILPSGPPNMGKYLATWFVYCLAVFRVAGTVAFMAYGVGHIVNSIWMGQPWSNTLKHVFDGLVYSLLLAG